MFKLAKLSNTQIVTTPHVLQYDKNESAAYVAVRFVPAYGALVNVLNQLKKRLPDFKPQSMLDFGCGPGTAILYYCLISASKEFFDIPKVVAIDSSESMLKILETVTSGDQKIENLELKRYLPLGATSVSLLLLGYTTGFSHKFILLIGITQRSN